MSKKEVAKKIELKKKRKKRNIAFKLAVTVFIISVAVSFVQTQAQLKKNNEQLSKIQEENEKQKLYNDELENILNSGNDLEHAEKIAREQLGMVNPNEIVFIDIAGN